MKNAYEKAKKAASSLLFGDWMTILRGVTTTDADNISKTVYEPLMGSMGIACLVLSADGLFNLATKNKTLVANRPGFEQFRLICGPETDVTIGDKVNCTKFLGQKNQRNYAGVVQKAAYYPTHIEVLVTSERLI